MAAAGLLLAAFLASRALAGALFAPPGGAPPVRHAPPAGPAGR